MTYKPPRIALSRHEKAVTYYLTEAYSFEWDHNGNRYRLFIPEAFPFDGATMPWLLRIFVGRWALGFVAPLVHDWLHFEDGKVIADVWTVRGWDTLGLVEFTRRDADRLFFRILSNDNSLPRWKRRMAFKLVRAWSMLKGDKW
jgi:hypothetical protein